MDKTRRYLNTRESFSLDRARKYKQAVAFKPMGLWYGFGDAWIEWCRSEMPQWVGPHIYEVELNGAKILALKTETDFFAFNREYKTDYYEEEGRRIEGMKTLLGVDWPRLAGEYDGIEVPTYLWQFRLHLDFMWYYGFDCASGCVWNLDKIGVRCVRTLKVPRDNGRQQSK